MTRQDNSSLRQKLERVANDPNAADLERAMANRRLAKLTPEDLTAESILQVDDSAYGESEREAAKRLTPKAIKIGKRMVKIDA